MVYRYILLRRKRLSLESLFSVFTFTYQSKRKTKNISHIIHPAIELCCFFTYNICYHELFDSFSLRKVKPPLKEGKAMRTEQIQYFLETVNAGSFTKAAANLHLQQQSLRESITNLENELGKALFNRSKKGVTLTEFGKNILPYLKNMYDTYLFALQYDTPLNTTESFIIQAQSALNTYTPGIYSVLSQRQVHKNIKISNIEEPEQIINSLLRHTCDLGLIVDACDSLKENSFYQANLNKTIEEYIFFEKPMVVAMAPQHPLAKKDALSLNDLHGQCIICSHSSNPLKNFIKKHSSISDIEYVNVFNYKLIETLCLSQNNITFLPKEMIDNPFLVYRPLKENLPMKFIVVYRKGEMTDDINLCIQHLKLSIQQAMSKNLSMKYL